MNRMNFNMTFFKYLAVLCAGAASAALASCDNELDVHELKRSGEFADALYTVRYFQYDGEGTLSLDNSLVLLPNDRYLLENEKFRLYYTSGCEESQNFVVVVEDNFGQSCELEFDFQHDNKNGVAVVAYDDRLPFVPRPLDALPY